MCPEEQALSFLLPNFVSRNQEKKSEVDITSLNEFLTVDSSDEFFSNLFPCI